MHRIVRRGLAVEACLRRFDGKSLQPGVTDCAILARHAMHKMGVSVPFMKGVRYRSDLGAAKVLKDLGFADLIEAVDALGLPRIAPAMTWQADLVALPSRDDGPWKYALAVVHTAGAGRIIGFGPDGVCRVGGKPGDIAAAWRLG